MKIKAVIKFIFSFFCSHRLELRSSEEYCFLENSGKKKGSVRITTFKCKVCDKYKTVVSDRK